MTATAHLPVGEARRTSWSAATSEFLLWQAAGGRSAETINLRRLHLNRIAKAFAGTSPFAVTTDDLAGWLGGQIGWAAETRRSHRLTLRAFYRWAVLTGRVGTDPSNNLAGVRVPAGIPNPAPEMQIRMALAAADSRLRAMILLGACCGLRRGEIARVHSDDVAGGTLRVLGKGGRTRSVPLPPVVEAALVGLPRPGYAFPGQVQGHLSPPHVGKLLSAALGEGWTGHSLRHRFASVAYASERDLRAVQTLLGHTKPETTARYTAVPDGALQRAVNAAAL